MIAGILQNAPIWVWPLLVVLIAVGLRASRAREARTWMVYALPVLGVLAVSAVSRLPAPVWIWGVFVLAYGLGALAGFRFQGRIILHKANGVARLSGEWLTLVVLMVIFWMNFAAGFTAQVMPWVYVSIGFHSAFAMVEGLASGSFLGRAARLLRAEDR